MMIAASLRPVALSVLSKPAAIASSAVNTPTTPGQPDDDDQRRRPALGNAADADAGDGARLAEQHAALLCR